MERQIKFRAWDMERKEMNYSGALGSGSGTDIISIEFNGSLNIQNAYGLDMGRRNPTYDPPLTNFILMQFTGFTDAGKSELYHKDVIENDGVNYIIEWDTYSGCWDCVDSEGNNIALFELASSRETWLQGNIHDNPELLKP